MRIEYHEFEAAVLGFLIVSEGLDPTEARLQIDARGRVLMDAYLIGEDRPASIAQWIAKAVRRERR